MTPCSLIDAASSFSFSSSKCFLGWYSFGMILSSSISLMPRALRSRSSSAERSGISAPSPLPSACFCIGQNLLGQLQVALRPPGTVIIQQHRLAVARRLGERDVPVNDGCVDLVPEELTHLLRHLR